MSALPEHDGLRRARPSRSDAAVDREPRTTLDEVACLAERLRASVAGSMRMSSETLDVVLATLLAGGHLLLEDHPGVGKTRLARTLAGSLDGRFARVQATVDLLPGDVVGTSVWRPDSGSFEFRPGPVFANVLLVDELNRATPKTQSGLLEAMQERQVTVDGRTRPIPPPFLVIATQNHGAGSDGMYPLPPAQLDRFMARVSLGYPSPEQEMLLLRAAREPALDPVVSPARLLAAQAAVDGVHTSFALVLVVVVAPEISAPTVTVTVEPLIVMVAAKRAPAAVRFSFRATSPRLSFVVFVVS